MSIRLTCPGCGYARAYRTQAVADYGFARHSCKNEQARQAKDRRVRARQANRNGIVRDCEHPIANHEHGTRTAYVLDRCRCAPCKDAVRAYEAERTRKHLYGRWDHRADAAPVRTHLLDLMAQGTSYKRAATLAGVPLTTVSQLIYGRHDRRNGEPPRTCAADLAAKILAVHADPWQRPGRGRMDATGSRRRIQALVTLGYSQSNLCRRLGIERSNLHVMSRPQVTVAMAKKIRDLYEELWDTVPPQATHHERINASRARNEATRRGWLPPLAWDDIDDPTERPDAGPRFGPLCEGCDHPSCTEIRHAHAVELDEIAVLRIMDGTLDASAASHRAERIEAIRRLAAARLTDRQIGERIGMQTPAVTNTRIRHGIAPGVARSGTGDEPSWSALIRPDKRRVAS